LAGDGGNDFLDGGVGQDIAEFLDVVGNVSIKKLTPNDIPAGFNPNGSAAFEFAFSRQGIGEADRLRDVEKIKFGDGEQRFLIEGEMKLGNANMMIDTGEGIDVVDFSKLAEGITTTAVQIAGQEYVISNQAGAAFRGVDVFVGTSLKDSMEGGEGAQILFGDEGDDVLRGGAGDDVLEGGAGDNFIETGAGNDKVICQSDDTIQDGDDGDRLFIRLSTLTGNPSQESTLIPILGGMFLISEVCF
jgi:Ca2+-binding RTX toxin-like protein